MQMTRQFIYLFVAFVVSFFKNLWWSHRAAGKSLNILVVSPPLLGPCTDMPSCSSCQLLLRCWKCLPLGLVQCTCPMTPHQSWVLKCTAVRQWCEPPSSHSYRVNKLVHQSLRHVRFADDALLVVLTYGAAQLVVVHCRPILSESPQSGNMSRVFDFKNT